MLLCISITKSYILRIILGSYKKAEKYVEILCYYEWLKVVYLLLFIIGSYENNKINTLTNYLIIFIVYILLVNIMTF